MFANFEICKTGLVTAKPERRYHRSATGCLECRQRKKKCDEQLPKCGLCVKYRTRCTKNAKSKRQPQHLPQSNLPHGSTEPHSSLEEAASNPPSHPSEDGTELDVVVASTVMSPSSNSSNCFENTGPSSRSPFSATHSHPAVKLPVALQSTVTSVFKYPSERRVLQYLSLKLGRVTCPSYIHPKYSILPHALPLSIESPAMKNALLACGFALLNRHFERENDRVLAKQYQCKAFNSLAANLLQAGEEVNLATMLLLHIFEKISCDSLPSKRLHLFGASNLVVSALTRRSKTASFPKYLIEAYIFHISLSSTFSGTISPPYPDDHVSKLLGILGDLSNGSDSTTLWKDSSLLGVSHGIFDIIFRTSQLRRDLPLSDVKRAEANTMKSYIQSWDWPFDANEQAEIAEGPPDGMIKTARLYRLACLLLLEKVIDTSLQSEHHVARTIVLESYQVLNQIPVDDVKHSIYLWPLLVLGCAAETPGERALFSASFQPSQDSSSNNGLGSWLQAHGFLQRSWLPGEHTGKKLGLDTLLRDDLLCQIFI